MAALTVIVVTWNNADTIEACLDSLRRSRLDGPVQTIVVDNNSADDTAGIVARCFPHVTLMRMPENLGFAAGNNRGMAEAQAPTLLLLNPDVVLCEPDALARMLGLLAGEPAVAVVGCRLVFPDGRHQVGDAGFGPSPVNMISHGLGIGHLLPGVRSLYLVRPDRIGHDSLQLDWVCGACLMVRRDVAHAMGGLDETLFLYAEDVAFGCGVRALGHQVAYMPGVRAIHMQGVSEAQTSFSVSTRWLESLIALYDRLNHRRLHAAVCVSFAIGFVGRACAYTALSMLRPDRHAAYRRRATALLTYAGAAFRLRQ